MKELIIGDTVHFIASRHNICNGKIINIRKGSDNSPNSPTPDQLVFLIETKYSGGIFKWWVDMENIIHKTSQNTNNLMKLYNIKKKTLVNQIEQAEETVKNLENKKIELFDNTVADMKNINRNLTAE